MDVVADRRAYEVLDFLVDGPAVSSSPELGSGAARFLPLVSLKGSLMVKPTDCGGGFRRARLLEREGVSSLSFCFPDVESLERVALIELLLERVILEVEGSDEVAADGCSERDKSRSCPLPLSLLFCFAALTLALERKYFDSDDDAAVDESSCEFDTDAPELLVASCGWIGCKSI